MPLITVKSKELVAALEVLDLVPARSGILPSEMVRLECAGGFLRMSLTAESFGQVFVSSDGHKDRWEFFVDRGMLFPFVLVVKDFYGEASTISFEFTAGDKKSNCLVLKSGRRKLYCQGCQPISGYGDLPSLRSASKLVITSKQGKLMRLASQYATADPTAAHLNCIYLVSKERVFTSNQVCIFSAPGKFPATVPYPLGMLSVLTADRLQAIQFAGKVVVANFGFGLIAQGISVSAARSFPVEQIKARLVEGRKMPKVLVLSARSFGAAVERLAAYVAATMRQDVLLRVRSVKNKDSVVSIEAAVPVGKFSETVAASVLKRPISWEWMLHFILPIVQYAASQKQMQVAVHHKEGGSFYLSAGDVELVMARKMGV